MQDNVQRVISYLILMVTLASLMGCGILTSSEAEKNNDIVDFVVSRQITGPQVISRNEAVEQQKRIVQVLEQWEEIGPNMNKVIAMSEDIAYVMDFLDSQNLTQSTGIADFEISQTPEEITDLVSNINKIDNAQNSGVQLEQAKPLFTQNLQASTVNASFSTPLEKSNKFQTKNNTNADTIKLSGSSDISDDASDTKFSSIDRNQLSKSPAVPSARPCSSAQSTSIADGSMFAIHLASYKQQTNLAGGLDILRTKFEKSLCGLAAVYKTVEVKGNEYFSLRIGPFNSQKDARNTCRDLSTQGQYCSVTRFDGVRL